MYYGPNGEVVGTSQYGSYHMITKPAQAAYWSTDSNGTVTGWGDVPANSNTSSQRITYSNPTYRYYANCGKTVGSTIDSYTIAY